MSRYVFKMPDLGEGTVEAEIVAWHVKVGDLVNEDQLMAEVMTDKAAVEVPAPVTGRVLSVTGAPGEMVKVGSELIVFETDAAAPAVATAPAAADTAAAKPTPAAPAPAASTAPSRSNGHRAERAPSTAVARRRTRDGVARDAATRTRGWHRSRAGRRHRPERAYHSRGSCGRIVGPRRTGRDRYAPARRRLPGAPAPRKSRSSGFAA